MPKLINLIRKRYQNGEDIKLLSKEYNCCISTIKDVVNLKTWKENNGN